MVKIIQNYSLTCELGSGAFSTVYKAINLKTKEEVAIKAIRVDKFKQQPKLQNGMFNQVNVLTNMQPCKYIIKYYDMLKTVNNFYFVYEYCNGGTLQKLLNQKKILSQCQALTYFGQLIQAFKILNKNNIIHRDLKPQNILFHNGDVKLADFGLCKPLQNKQQVSKTMLGTPLYMAPEVIKGQVYSIKADIWSLGVVLYRMLYGTCPFESHSIAKLIGAIDSGEMVLPNYPIVDIQTKNLLKKMICKNIDKRIDWNELFSYIIVDGKLKQKKDPLNNINSNKLQKSLTLTESTTSTTSNYKQVSQQFFNPNTDIKQNTQVRSAITSKSGFRQTFRQQMIIKNHNKCIDIFSYSIYLLSFEQLQINLLGFHLIKIVKNQLKQIQEVINKQLNNKKDDILMNYQNIFILQQKQMNEIYNNFKNNFKIESKLQIIEQKNIKQYYHIYLKQLNKQKKQEVIQATRIFDFLFQGLVLKKQTYQSIPTQRLWINLLNKACPKIN